MHVTPSLFLALVVLLASSANVAQGRKKLNRHSKRCALSHGKNQAECDGLVAKGCPVTWVGSCADPAFDGMGGCQVKNDCARMKCPSTCSKNGNCHWDSSSGSCAAGPSTAKFCQITARGDGNDIFLSADRSQVFANASSQWGYAFTCTTSKTVSDWYYRVDSMGSQDDIMVGITPGPFDLVTPGSSGPWSSWSYNPSTNPAGGFWFDGEDDAWSDLQYSLNTNQYRYCSIYMYLVPGDILGVHLNRKSGMVWWDINGKNVWGGCPMNVNNASSTLEYYGGVGWYANQGPYAFTYLG